MKSFNYTPLLYLHNGNLLAYRYGTIYILDSESFAVIRKLPLPLGWIEKWLARIRIVFRILRLGVKNAIQIDDENVLLFVNKRFYEVNLRTCVLTDGFVPPEGMRALNVTEVKGVEGFDDSLLFGAYFSPFSKREIPIYHRVNAKDWKTVFTFPASEVNHIHNIVPDRINRCLWILTGDFGEAAAIWMARDNFQSVERVISGSQEARSCVAFPVDGKLVYATDSPFSRDSIRVLEEVDGKWQSRKLVDIAGSCIYGCRWGGQLVFSTAVEPDGRGGRFSMFSTKRGAGIADQYCHLYVGDTQKGFSNIYRAEKDRWPYPLCQFGTLQFPAGHNPTDSLLVYHMATKRHDCKTVVINTKQ